MKEDTTRVGSHSPPRRFVTGMTAEFVGFFTERKARLNSLFLLLFLLILVTVLLDNIDAEMTNLMSITLSD